MILHTIPANTLPLYLFYFLVSNAGAVIPYYRFDEITQAYGSSICLQIAVSHLRPILRLNGYEVRAVNGVGYECYEAFTFFGLR